MLSGCSVRPVPPPEATEKYFLPLLKTFFLVSTCYRMLETCRVGGVTCDGNVYAFFPHDCYTFRYAVCAVAVYFCTKSFRVRFSEYFFYFVLCMDHILSQRYVNPLIREMICAASFPRPFRITRSGFLRTLFAFSAIPIAPSAAAKDS